MGKTVGNAVSGLADDVVKQAEPSLSGVKQSRSALASQLQDLDGAADAYYDSAEFHLPGIVLRGWISVAHRKRPQLAFKKLDADGLSAFDSWIPGGRIDRPDIAFADRVRPFLMERGFKKGVRIQKRGQEKRGQESFPPSRPPARILGRPRSRKALLNPSISDVHA